ncbi:hypothetical protein E05_38520 [Plautia stali symbiont]|nr:hypothetical protein E05_38520 [Plautia stali symbiont]
MLWVKSDFAGDLHAVRFGLHAVELNALIGLEQLDTVQMAKEIKVPPGAAELTVGHHLQTVAALLHHHLANRIIFYLTQLVGAEGATGELLACLLNGSGTQKTADGIGAERGGIALHIHSCTGA